MAILDVAKASDSITVITSFGKLVLRVDPKETEGNAIAQEDMLRSVANAVSLRRAIRPSESPDR